MITGATFKKSTGMERDVDIYFDSEQFEKIVRKIVIHPLGPGSPPGLSALFICNGNLRLIIIYFN